MNNRTSILETNQLTSTQKESLLAIWNQEYPVNLSHAALTDLEHYLESLIDARHYILMEDADRMVGWSATFIRDEGRWFALLLDSSVQGRGNGTRLLNRLKEVEEELNGWVIEHATYIKQDGTYYKSPMEFYKKNGFHPCPAVRLETEKMSAVKINWTRL